MNTTPYANLDPHTILNAIEQLGLQCSGSLFPLNSYENRVYQIGMEEGPPLIAKFYRPNRWSDEAILEEHQFTQALATQDIPVIAPIVIGDTTLHCFQDFRFALFPRKGGRALELDNVEQLEWMGRFIGRLHAVGACQSFQHRIKLDVHSYGYQPYQFLIANDFIPLELKRQYDDTISILLQQIEQCFKKAGEVDYIRVHGDCHAGNILWNDNGPHIVDLDDCLMAPAIQDIWMLVSGATEYDIDRQLKIILRGYRQFHDFNPREIHLMDALRSLRMIHYAAWLARRWEDPAFPMNFPWFNTLRYWQEHLQHLHDQSDKLNEQ